MKRVVTMVLSVAAFGAPHPATAAPDRVVELIGTWSCRTAYRDFARVIVTKDRDAIVVREAVRYADEEDVRVERFRAASGSGWRVEPETDPGFRGTGPAWTGPTWTLDGQLHYRDYGDTREEHVRYERPDDRTLRIVRWTGANESNAHDVELCLRGGVPPDESTCIVPNLPATTLHAVEPETPRAAALQRISGTVQVMIRLDADSKLVDASIVSSPSRLLNESAVDAARLSTYRTAHRNCSPVPGQYIFSVSYQFRP